jgi:hypothetical protein
MSGPERRASTGQRFMPTLRGLRYLEHRKNQPALVGTIVPWTRIQFMSGNHALAATILDHDGNPAGTKWNRVTWTVPYSQRRAVRWAAKRAERAMIAEGSYDIRETDRERKGIVWLYRVVIAAMLALVGAGIWSLSLPPGSPAAAALARNGFHRGSLLFFALYPGLAALLVHRRATTNVASVRVFGDGLEAEMVNGQREFVRWTEVRRVRRGQTGPFLVESVNGLRLRFMARRAAFVLRDWMERVGGEPTEKQQLRSLIIRCAIWCQLGGIAGAGLLLWLGGTGKQTPLLAYVGTGLLLPLVLLFTVKFDDWAERAARRTMRGRSRKRPKSTPTSSATSAAQ